MLNKVRRRAIELFDWAIYRRLAVDPASVDNRNRIYGDDPLIIKPRMLSTA